MIQIVQTLSPRRSRLRRWISGRRFGFNFRLHFRPRHEVGLNVSPAHRAATIEQLLEAAAAGAGVLAGEDHAGHRKLLTDGAQGLVAALLYNGTYKIKMQIQEEETQYT